MADTRKTLIIQISGLKRLSIKKKILECIQALGGTYLGGSIYRDCTTHLIVRRACASEKFLAASAAGKWILPPEYVLDSGKHGRWLNEQSYQWHSSVLKDWSPRELQILNSAKCWRQKLASSKMPGAFQGWKVVLLTEDDEHRQMFERVLKAGNAIVYQQISASSEITHVFKKKVEIDKEHMKALNVPCYSVSYIGEYLYGKEIAESRAHMLDSDEENCLDLSQCSTVNSQTDILTDFDMGDEECSKLENTLKDEICAPEALKSKYVPTLIDCYITDVPQGQSINSGFSQGSIHRIEYLLADALFTEALEELRYCLSAGGLPPAPLIHSLMKHALEGDAGPVFSPMFMGILLEILHHNPPWRVPLRVSYFLDILQCPDCKKGTWSLLEMAIRFCIDGGPFCHHTPGPVQPGLTEFLVELLRYFLRLIEYDLHDLNSNNSGDWKGANPTVLVKIFWSVWEKSKLTTNPIERLTEFVVIATKWLNASKEAAKIELVYILHSILGVVVEYWIRENLNWDLTEKGVKDLAEYLVMLCEDFSFTDLETLITYQQSPWLNMFTADAIYRKFCLQNSIAFHPEPLSLFKIVSSYVTALGRLSSSGPSRGRNPGGKKMGPWPGIEPHTPEFTPSDDSQSPANVLPNLPAFKKSIGDSKPLPAHMNIPKGLHKVNMVGETLLHRACKRNQVERLIGALHVPGVDINVKDHAGWTPLHEACNHGSIECVHAILQHCPDVDLLTQVDGVSPLHDALSVGELDIAKLLLRQGGAVLLQQRDKSGRTPLDYVHSQPLKEELLDIVREGNSPRDGQGDKLLDGAFLEMCSCLLSCLIMNYLVVYNLPMHGSFESSEEVNSQLARFVAVHTFEKVTSMWKESRLIRHAKDIETLLKMSEYYQQVPNVLKKGCGIHSEILLAYLQILAFQSEQLNKNQG